jgi:hypothetical protein
MPARVVRHVNELAVGIVATVYVPSTSNIEYAVPANVTEAPIEK